MAQRLQRVVGVAAVLITATAFLSACSGTNRSVEAFCSTMDTHKTRYLEQMSAAQSGGLGGLVTATSAVGDLKLMWRELADVAPSDIQTDTEAVRDAWEKQEDNAAQMDWKAAIATGLLNSGSMSRVDTYVRTNCDGDYSVAEAATEESPAPADEPSPPVLTDTWTDNDGYTYSFTLDTAAAEATKDVANAKPGEANISWSYTFSGTVTNTTPDRNAPSVELKVQPMWAAGSSLCSLIGPLVDRAFDSNTAGREEGWCTRTNFPFSLSTSGDIPMDGLATVQTSGGSVYAIAVPEANAEAIMAELKSPTLWAVARDQGDGRLTDCLLASGGWYLSKSTADTGCTAK